MKIKFHRMQWRMLPKWIEVGIDQTITSRARRATPKGSVFEVKTASDFESAVKCEECKLDILLVRG